VFSVFLLDPWSGLQSADAAQKRRFGKGYDLAALLQASQRNLRSSDTAVFLTNSGYLFLVMSQPPNIPYGYQGHTPAGYQGAHYGNQVRVSTINTDINLN
jgi:hypothetical protein